jgi:hypothetical protein
LCYVYATKSWGLIVEKEKSTTIDSITYINIC